MTFGAGFGRKPHRAAIKILGIDRLRQLGQGYRNHQIVKPLVPDSYGENPASGKKKVFSAWVN